MPFAHVQSCNNYMHRVPLKVHINEGVPTAVEFVRPGEAQDNYIPPDKTPVYQIRKAVEDAGAINICQEEGRLFATFSDASKISEQIYGQKIPVEDIDGRKYDNGLERFRTAASKSFFDLTLKYLYGEMEVETYLAQTADASPSDNRAAFMYLHDTLWLDNYRAMGPTPDSFANVGLRDLLIRSGVGPEDAPRKWRHVIDKYIKANTPLADVKIQDLLNKPELFDSEDASDNWRHLAQVYLQANRLKEAIATSRWAVRLDPEEPNNWRILAKAHYQYYGAVPTERAHLLKEVVHARAKVMESDKDDFENMFGLGLAYMGLEQMNLAVKSIEEAIAIHLRQSTELSQEDGIALSRLSEAYFRLGRYEDALHAAKEANKLHQGHDVSFLFTMGVNLLMLGRPAEALEPIKQSLSLEPEWGEIWDALGRALRGLNRLDEAISAFKTAIEKGTQDTIRTRWQLIKAMADLYSQEQKEDPNMLMEIYSKLCSIAQEQPESNNSDLFASLGNTAYALSQFFSGYLEIAEFYYEKAAQLDPNNPELWSALTRIYNLTGRPADRLNALKQELLALERMLVNGVEGEKAEAIEARIQELRDILDILSKTGMDDPEGGSAPPFSPAGPNGIPTPEGGGHFMRSTISVGGLAINSDDLPQSGSTSSTLSRESATILYRRRYSQRNTTTTTIDIMRNSATSTFGLPFPPGVTMHIIRPAGLPLH